MTGWKVISTRKYTIDKTYKIPEWDNQGEIDRYLIKAAMKEGFVATRRRLDGNIIVEQIVYRERKQHVTHVKGRN